MIHLESEKIGVGGFGKSTPIEHVPSPRDRRAFWGCIVNFRLSYRGRLLPADHNDRVDNKHEIRRQLHEQLSQLWSEMPLSSETWPLSYEKPTLRGFTFLPIVCAYSRTLCHLTIQISRVGWPGVIIDGDLDNRVKTLIDGLRRPRNENEIPPLETPQAGENPFCVLLDDDSLVTSFSVRSKKGRGVQFNQNKYYVETEIIVDVVDQDADV